MVQLTRTQYNIEYFLYKERIHTLKLENINSLSGVFRKNEIAFLLEIIRSEYAEVPGFPYLTKKCYLVEQLCKTDLFEFKPDSIRGASSEVVMCATRTIRSFKVARIVGVGYTASRTTRNHCGEECQEYISLTDEQIVDQYLQDLTNDRGLKRWQQAIDKINHHPHGKDWYTLSVAVHLHSQQSDWSRTISEIRKQAKRKKVFLPNDAFKDAVNLLRNIGLHKPE